LPGCHCDFLDVLGGGGEEGLPSDALEAAIVRVLVAVELFGVCEEALDGLLSSLVDPLAPVGQAVGVGALTGVGPDVVGEGPFGLRAGGAGRQQGTVAADRSV